jgi:hypothetical protein
MNVRLHIDRLVLEGVSVSAAGRPHLQAAIEAELTRLIAAGGISPELARGIAVPSVPAPPMTVAADEKPSRMGTAIAGAVYGSIGTKT